MAGIRRHHTRRLQSLMLTAACFLSSSKAARAALPDDSRWHASATLAAGTKAARLILNITEAPAPGDSIQVTVSTRDVATVLATPSSKNITKQSATEGGFRWIQGSAGPAPLGSDDPGQITQFVFNRAGIPGQYVVNFTFSKLQVPARVEVHFTSRMKDFVDLIQQTPGARILGPVKLAPAARLSFDLPQDLENQLIDIVVPDAAVTVELTLPEGRILRQSTVDPSQVEWKVFAESKDDEQPPFLFALDITLPLEGTHHFIHLKDAPKGRYEIHAQSGATSGGNLTLAVLPFAALAKASGAIMRTGKLPAAGEVKIRPKPLPSECFAGEKLEVRVELLGDIGTQTPQFEVRFERRSWLSETTSGAKLAPPDPVETLPVEFTREGERTYRGLVTLTKAGSVRISVRANGETSRGQRFTDEALITDAYMKVKPVVAKFLSLGGKAVSAADSEKFDHLEISATLQVIEAGDYLANFMLRDASGTRLQGGGGVSTKTRLEKGRQTLTASVPSAKIWHELRDGPLEIASVQIWRTSLSQVLWVEVPTDGASFRTASYKRDQWDRGPIFGNDQLNVHGIAAAPSGQFLYVEAEWEVTTPGGSCEWYGSLDRKLTAPVAKDTVRTLQAFERAKLPAGRTKISFLFDGPEIQRSAQQEWRLWAGLRCARSEGNLPDLTFVLIPPQQIRLNPEEYESRSSIVVHVNSMRLVQGGVGRTTVSVPQGSANDVQFSLGELPKGIDAQLRIPEGDSKLASRQLLIETAAHIAPGRYFIPITAVTGDEKTTTQCVLDIDPY